VVPWCRDWKADKTRRASKVTAPHKPRICNDNAEAIALGKAARLPRNGQLQPESLDRRLGAAQRIRCGLHRIWQRELARRRAPQDLVAGGELRERCVELLQRQRRLFDLVDRLHAIRADQQRKTRRVGVRAAR
jgi:hypothetical protein